MRWQPYWRRLPARDISSNEGDATSSLAFINVTLRELYYSTGRVFRRWRADSTGTREEPIRAELFSVERLEQHAKSLAAAQRSTSKPTTDRRLEKRFWGNVRALRTAYHATVRAVREGRTITPGADWLVDNFHVVEEQIREIRTDLPPGFSRQLPKLIDGPLEGYPRVFGLAWAFVAHTDSRFDPEMLRRFVRAYQCIQPLTIGELWAVAITLRVVLVENLRRLAEDIAKCQSARQEADALADLLLGLSGRAAEPVDAVLQGFERPLPTAFAVQLVQRLRDQDPNAMTALHWLDERLDAQETTADAIVHEEHQRQGAVNVTIRNIITSMRRMSAIDWRKLFESVSLVDEMLRADSNFAAFDFQTRDLYRNAIEEMARHSNHSEIEVTRRVLLAGKHAKGEAQNKDDTTVIRRQDPGYYLIAQGRPAFERALGCHDTIRGWLVRANATVGISGYLGVVAIITAFIAALVLSWNVEPSGIWAFCGLVLLVLIPASDAAMALANCGATNRFDATTLPGLELSEGVPSSLRTMVVTPTLLTSLAAITEQVERLEVHHLANSDGDLCFALLSDWTDAATERTPADDELLRAAAEGIASLNRRYGPGSSGDRFLLLHRRRLWNEGQGKWIGWERKRGKLHELNRLLRGASDTTYIPAGGHAPTVPADVRYVIVLDADTRLPRGVAKRLIGKIAHPLNHPVLDRRSGRVVEGYAVLQPRVTPSLPLGGEGSLFQRVFSHMSGLDPYACAASDVYQDLFGEGSYCGKGIYDVDFFEAALAGRIPDNTVLSHDLLEGIFARAGLVSDIEVFDEFPARYDVAVARHYRWVRGDWQLLPWILGRG
jgi:cyclic beta-1,2-glucan glucanotransferase